jgi:hypothetical protein
MDESFYDDGITADTSLVMLEDHARDTQSLGIVAAHAPNFDKLSETARRYAEIEYEGKKRGISNLGAAHLVGLSQRGRAGTHNEVSPEDKLLDMELALLTFLIPKSQKELLASVLNRITRRYDRQQRGMELDSDYIPIVLPTSVNDLRLRFWGGPNSIVTNVPMPEWSVVEGIPILLPSTAIRYLAAMDIYMESLRTDMMGTDTFGSNATTSSKAKAILSNAILKYRRRVLSLAIILWSDGFQTNVSKVNRDSSGAKVITGTFGIPQDKINSTASNTMVLALAKTKDDLSTAWRYIMNDIMDLGTPREQTEYFATLTENVEVHAEVLAILQDVPEKREHLGEGAHNGTYTSSVDYVGNLKDTHEKLSSCETCLEARINGLMRDCTDCADWNHEDPHGILAAEKPKDYPVYDVPDGITILYRKQSFDRWLNAADKTWNHVTKRHWTPKEGLAYCLAEGMNKKTASKIVEGADDNEDQCDAEEDLQSPRDMLPPAWISGKKLEDYVHAIMHILFLGTVRTIIHLLTSWLKAKRKSTAFVNITVPLVDPVQCLQLQWLPLQKYKESLGGFVSENVLAYC